MMQVADDGLTPQEREAYAKCRRYSCVHEACVKRWYNTLDQPQRSKAKCGALHEQWKRCFASAMAMAMAPAEVAATTSAATSAGIK